MPSKIIEPNEAISDNGSFNTNNTSNRMQISTTSTGSEVLFQNYKSLSIIPLDTIEGEKTSFYNEEFREIIKDSNKFP